jgi:hypothetical protein
MTMARAKPATMTLAVRPTETRLRVDGAAGDDGNLQLIFRKRG